MKANLLKLCAVLFAASTILMSGCSKSDGSSGHEKQKSDQPSLSSALSAEGQKAAAIAALPKGNADTPLDQYVPLTSGNQLMLFYYGISNMPVDYEKIAQGYSQEYRATSDVFKKQDMLKALKPRIDAEITRAKNTRYFRIEDVATLANYDLNAKAFPVNDALLTAGGFGYFNDNGEYKYTFSNGEDFKNLKTTDEGKAREIESMLTKFRPMKIVYYAYAQDIDSSTLQIKAQIMKVRLLDASGNELLAQ